MWKSTVGDRVLEFELVGLNNQNFVMYDRQTGTWWQQVTGEAIQGPLKGERLELMPFEQVTFELWSREHPDSRYLDSQPEFADRYWNELESEENRDGEGFPFVTKAEAGDPLEQGELVMAVLLGDEEKAYPMRLLREQSPVQDEFAGRPVLVVVGDDGRSVRCFDRTLDGETLELYAKPETETLTLVDAGTGSTWDFSGTATAGPLEGRRLERLQVYSDYWFDWKKFNPGSPVYTAGDL